METGQSVAEALVTLKAFDFISVTLSSIEISLIALFGGSSMIVPQNWNVKTDVFALFGGINDRRKTTEKIDSNKTLLIKGFVIFGGGEIKCRELK